MRKYIKPVIIMEDFLLTESVAGCDANVFDTMGKCANNVDAYEELKAMGVFTSEESCFYTSGEFELNGIKICLHSSTGTNVFSS